MRRYKSLNKKRGQVVALVRFLPDFMCEEYAANLHGQLEKIQKPVAIHFSF